MTIRDFDLTVKSSTGVFAVMFEALLVLIKGNTLYQTGGLAFNRALCEELKMNLYADSPSVIEKTAFDS